MQLKLITTILIASAFLVGYSQLKPTVSLTNAFPQGKERSYSFISDTTISDYKNGPNIGYRLTGTIRIGSIWSANNYNLLKLQLIQPTLKTANYKTDNSIEYNDHRSLLYTAANKEFYALWHMGEITKVFTNTDEEEFLVNLKKSLVGLFQYQLLDGFYIENDISGKCNVKYESQSPNVYRKEKIDCQADDHINQTRLDGPIGIAMIPIRQTDFTVTNDGILEKIESFERYSVAAIGNKNFGSAVESRMTLKFDGGFSTLSTISAASHTEAIATLKGFREQSLLATTFDECQNNQCPSLKSVIKDVKNKLVTDKMGSSEAAVGLLKLIPSARQASTEELLQILNAHTMKELKPQLYDLLASAQTINAHRAAFSTFDLTSEKNIIYIERYLQTLSVGSRPPKLILEELFQAAQKNIKSDKIKDTLLQSLASVANRFTKLSENQSNLKIVENIVAFLKDSFAKCSNTKCKDMYIRAMLNLKHSDTVDLLLTEAISKDRKISVSAMKALGTYSTQIWNVDRRKKLENIFYQRIKKFDSSARTIALDIIFALRPTVEELKHLLEFLQSKDKAFEVKQYLLQKIALLSEKCPRFKRTIQLILTSNPMLNNYHVLGQRGLTTALSRDFSRMPAFNGTLLSVQEIQSGVLKRGVVDMIVHSNNDKFSIFTLGLYAGGLSSFVSGSDDDDNNGDDEEEESATAGMEITIQGSQLRPLEFFNGQGELMGHVWSGTASDPTPAYTATTLLQDHKQLLRLQNGATLSVNILGAASINLNGQIQMSLWNRNAHSVIENNAGLALLGSINYDSGLIRLLADLEVIQEPQMSLVSDVDFSSDVMLCLQLSQPSSILKHTIKKTVQIIGTKMQKVVTKKITYHFPGNTHALNRKNNEMCNGIFES